MADKMSRMGVDCAVVYVDADCATPGDGSSPAVAMKEIPVASARTGDTVYLCRKTLSANVVCKLPVGECYFIAMPREGDELRKEVPEAAKTAWPGDEPATMALVVTAAGAVSFGPIQQ